MEPPGRRPRRACKAIEEAKKVKEERIFNECPHVMMVGHNEEVRQRAADRVHDEGRRQLDAIERGEGGGGDLTIKEEVVDEEEERPEERRQQLDALLQQGGKLGDGNTIKEEVSEGEEAMMLEANPFGSILTDGQAVAIPTDLLQELEVKEEEQDDGGYLVIRGGEGEGTLQEPILLNDEEDEAVTVNEAEGEEETDQVIKGN